MNLKTLILKTSLGSLLHQLGVTLMNYLYVQWQWSNYRGPGGGLPTLSAGPLLVFRVEALGGLSRPPTSVEKCDSVFGRTDHRPPQITSLTAPLQEKTCDKGFEVGKNVEQRRTLRLRRIESRKKVDTVR